ncbi:MAG: Glycogen phosphorylase, partial [uncultured Gemmatimonadaceae bacterium]
VSGPPAHGRILLDGDLSRADDPHLQRRPRGTRRRHPALRGRPRRPDGGRHAGAPARLLHPAHRRVRGADGDAGRLAPRGAAPPGAAHRDGGDRGAAGEGARLALRDPRRDGARRTGAAARHRAAGEQRVRPPPHRLALRRRRALPPLPGGGARRRRRADGARHRLGRGHAAPHQRGARRPARPPAPRAAARRPRGLRHHRRRRGRGGAPVRVHHAHAGARGARPLPALARRAGARRRPRRAPRRRRRVGGRRAQHDAPRAALHALRERRRAPPPAGLAGDVPRRVDQRGHERRPRGHLDRARLPRPLRPARPGVAPRQPVPAQRRRHPARRDQGGARAGQAGAPRRGHPPQRRVPRPGGVHARLRPPRDRLQARGPDLPRHRPPARDRAQARPAAARLRRQGAPARRGRQGPHPPRARRAQRARRRPARGLRRELRDGARRAPDLGLRRVAQQPDAPPRGLGHQRDEGRAQRGAEPLDDRRLVGGGVHRGRHRLGRRHRRGHRGRRGDRARRRRGPVPQARARGAPAVLRAHERLRAGHAQRDRLQRLVLQHAAHGGAVHPERLRAGRLGDRGARGDGARV